MLFPVIAGFFLKGTCLVAFALVLRSALRSRLSAAVRYRIVFLSVAALPLLAAVSVLQSGPFPSTRGSGTIAARPAGPQQEAPSVRPGSAGAAAPLRIPETAADCLVSLWLIVAAILAARAAASRISAARAVSVLPPCSDSGWLGALRVAEEKRRLRRTVRLLDGGDLPPFTGGLAGRSVAVPSVGRLWSPAERTAALLHEIAHVERRDVPVMAVADFIAAAFWFCPPIRLAVGALREDREEACDAAAVAAGASPSEFAALILGLASDRLECSIPGCSMGISGPTKVERRIAAILSAGVLPGRRSVLGPVAAAALMLAVLGAASATGAAGLFAVETSAPVPVLTADADGAPVTIPMSRSPLPIASPLAGTQWRVSQVFGRHSNPLTGKEFLHTGIDLTDGRSGEPVRSTLDGIVTASGRDESQGNFVVVSRGDLAVRFLKLESRRVAEGDRVSAGSIVGTVGSTGIATGPHLHYEVWVKGSPVDPAALLKAGGARYAGL